MEEKKSLSLFESISFLFSLKNIDFYMVLDWGSYLQYRYNVKKIFWFSIKVDIWK